MKTKDEIIQGNISLGPEPLVLSYNTAVASMDGYAMQEAIGFAEWIVKNKYEQLAGGKWRLKGADWLSKDYKTSELFTLYKERK